MIVVSERRGQAVGAHDIRADVEDGWLLIERSIDNDMPSLMNEDASLSADLMWQLLRGHGALAGGAKFVALPSSPQLVLRAEVPCEDELDTTPDLDAACQGFSQAIHLLHNPETDTRLDFTEAAVPCDADAEHKVCDLASVCAACGWPLAERAGDGLAFTLDTPDGFWQAQLVSKSQLGALAQVELISVIQLSDESRLALGLVLLEASALIRFGRAVAFQRNGRDVVGFEVTLGQAPTPARLAAGLAALSMACRLCGGEVAALAEKSIAQAYLQIRGWSS